MLLRRRDFDREPLANPILLQLDQIVNSFQNRILPRNVGVYLDSTHFLYLLRVQNHSTNRVLWRFGPIGEAISQLWAFLGDKIDRCLVI